MKSSVSVQSVEHVCDGFGQRVGWGRSPWQRDTISECELHWIQREEPLRLRDKRYPILVIVTIVHQCHCLVYRSFCNSRQIRQDQTSRYCFPPAQQGLVSRSSPHPHTPISHTSTLGAYTDNTSVCSDRITLVPLKTISDHPALASSAVDNFAIVGKKV